MEQASKKKTLALFLDIHKNRDVTMNLLRG